LKPFLSPFLLIIAAIDLLVSIRPSHSFNKFLNSNSLLQATGDSHLKYSIKKFPIEN
jgi:hypothetical protein